MVARRDEIAISVPGMRAVRWRTDGLYSGMKETYTIGRVESGRSHYWHRGKVWTTGPRSILIKQPGDVHRDLAHTGQVVYQIVSFSPRDVERLVGRVRLVSHLPVDDARGAAFQRLHDATSAGADQLTLEVAVAEAIDALTRIGDAKSEQTRPVQRAFELLREKLAEPVTLDELAAHAGLDKFRLCRAFRTQVGLPPHAYLTRLRIMRAKQLLDDGIRPSEVAPQVGLYDQSQLNRHFRRIVGTTPGQYARSVGAH